MMVRRMARTAANNACTVPGDREEVIVTYKPDPAVDTLVARSAAALDSIAGWAEDEIDGLITALAAQIAARAEELAVAAVAETGIGCVPDNADKNRVASLGVAQSLIGKPGVGVVGRHEPQALTESAEPMGVILGLIPVTNPVATLVFKALICIKARDEAMNSTTSRQPTTARLTGTLPVQVARCQRRRLVPCSLASPRTRFRCRASRSRDMLPQPTWRFDPKRSGQLHRIRQFPPATARGSLPRFAAGLCYASSPACHRFRSRPAPGPHAHVEHDSAVGQAAHGVEIHLHELQDSAQQRGEAQDQLLQRQAVRGTEPRKPSS
jgi:hypothetical protein